MKKRFKFIVFILIICLLAAFLLSSRLFEITRINVYGNKNVTADEIIRLSSIRPGQNIFRINIKKSMRSIFQDPYIKMIRIKRILPSTISIDIIEREAFALVPFVGSYLNIDDEGIIINISMAVDKPELPIINGLEFDTFKIGELLRVEDTNQLTVTVSTIREIIRADMMQKIKQVDVSDIYNIKLLTDTGIKLNLGDDRKLDNKMTFAKSIIEDLEKENLKGTVEMGHEGNPIYKPE